MLSGVAQFPHLESASSAKRAGIEWVLLSSLLTCPGVFPRQFAGAFLL
jgi:hypothetical protein